MGNSRNWCSPQTSTGRERIHDWVQGWSFCRELKSDPINWKTKPNAAIKSITELALFGIKSIFFHKSKYFQFKIQMLKFGDLKERTKQRFGSEQQRKRCLCSPFFFLSFLFFFLPSDELTMKMLVGSPEEMGTWALNQIFNWSG